MYVNFISLIKKLLSIIGCDVKHLFNLIEGSWGEQPDMETPPKDEDEPVFKKFRASSPTPPAPLHLQLFLPPPPDNIPPSISFPLGKLEHWLVFLLGSSLAMNCATVK